MHHGRDTRSTVDWRRCGQEDAGVPWCAHRSLATGHSEAQELTNDGAKERRECGEPGSSLTRAQAPVWWPSDGDEAAAEGGLGGSGF
jgi:hypothetical protein